VVGLTATPQRRDGLQPIIHMQIGPIRFKVDPRGKLAKRTFEHRLVVRETGFDTPTQATDVTIQKIYSLLVANEKRNELIIDDVLLAMEEGRSPILLTERKNHLEYLHQQLKGFVRHIVVLQGGQSVKERLRVQEQLASIPIDEERLLLATGRYIGEGFDDARLDTLFLTLPVSCSASCPVLSKFCKVIGVPYYKNLWLLHYTGNKALFFLGLRTKLACRHHYRVDLPTQLFLR
jgi:superfamily II DNA or RNA helicase